ncbi:Protein EXPORTIN 1A [Hibiscus syriacus]|uniref:Protein EXPORTIN 1A n=1 Tax=Hibiscus syriacus TaxID=106335 RepID=A0A6A2Z6Y3_HIBSY|nr:Protein EXPORTIN 1A [Hibiscus syriacus]
MWLQVVHILQQTKSFEYQVLEDVIKYRWNALPFEQRDGMKNYISEVIVQVLKHDWPTRWKSFIPDLVAAANTSETICENCMTMLKLLSEEVFDFSRGEMTLQKIKELKQSLNSVRKRFLIKFLAHLSSLGYVPPEYRVTPMICGCGMFWRDELIDWAVNCEFKLIHELCLYILSASQRTELIRATLSTLHAFLSWIPLGYIFESTLLETLLKLFPVPSYRNLTLQCLTETILPPTTNIPEAYAHGSSEEQAFIQNLALFFTSFYKFHIRVLETAQDNIAVLLIGLEYLINISYVDDTEVFKVCLDYWNSLVLGLFDAHHNMDNPAVTASMMGLQLRMLMICRLAKPEEVLIVEDENGNIVRETMKDNDVLVQYKIMRETLIYLSHLDLEDTEKQKLKKLSKQLTGEDWTWNNLNTLCWAIGSISGSMMEEQENRFLVTVIRDLLSLCEITKGKDNKAIIASNIMYVVGQYPRFLRAHWKFLKTVFNKLFEFMHETHPGVQGELVPIQRGTDTLSNDIIPECHEGIDTPNSARKAIPEHLTSKIDQGKDKRLELTSETKVSAY